MRFYDSAQEAYIAHQVTLRNLLGVTEGYATLDTNQRKIVRNKLLMLTHYVANTLDKPAFILFDFGVLYDANLLLENNATPDLEAAVDSYIMKQIDYFAGFSASLSTAYDSFLSWAKNAEISTDCPVGKVICTSYMLDSDDISIVASIGKTMLLKSAVDAKEVLEHGVGANNGLRLAALFDAASVDESAKVILAKASDEVAGRLIGGDEFLQALLATDTGEIFATGTNRDGVLEEAANKWNVEQRKKLENLLKKAKREAIRQKNLQASQVLVDSAHQGQQRLGGEYVASVDKVNEHIAQQNAAVTKTNTAAKSANGLSAAANAYSQMAAMHGAAANMSTQALIGGGQVTHAFSLSASVSNGSGLTVNNSHLMHQGGRTIAAASSTWNAPQAYNQRAAAVASLAQSRQPAHEVPLYIREPFIELRQFLADNSQNLQGFEVPQISLANPYTCPSSIFFQGFTPGVTQPNNFGQLMVEQYYTFGSTQVLQNFSFTPRSEFTREPAESFWHNMTSGFQQSNWRPSAPYPLAAPKKDPTMLDRVAKATVDTVVTILTGSSAAEASPMVVTSAAVTSVAPPGVSAANMMAPKMTVRQLQAELTAAANKALLIHFMITNPSLAQHVYDVLVTPAHPYNPEDAILPGGTDVNVEASVPPSTSREEEVDTSHTGHALSRPSEEEMRTPGYTQYDGEPLHFMFRGNDNSLYGGGKTAGNAVKTSEKPDRTIRDPLRRSKHGDPAIDPEFKGKPHTQLGTKNGRKGSYTQAREFDAHGKAVRDIDFTDHGRPHDHPNPHQHRYETNGTGGTLQRSKKPEPIGENYNVKPGVKLDD